MQAASEVPVDLAVEEAETAVTLSTCTEDSAVRQVVQGIRVKEAERDSIGN